MLRLSPSDPLFPDWNELLTAYAALLNPSCHWNLREVDREAVEYRPDVVIWTQQVKDKFAETKVMKMVNELELTR